MPETTSIPLRQFEALQQSSLGAKIRVLGSAIAVFLVTIALQPTLRAENATEDARFDDPTASSFGWDVAVSGSFALVAGASGTGDDVTGAVYSYQKIGGEWVFDEKFFAPNSEDFDRFSSVAMFGDVAIIGAPRDDDPIHGEDSGSAFLFRHNGSEWVFEQKITPSDAGSNRRFGGAVAISGTVAVVGVGAFQGAETAYVFRYNGTTWVEEKILTASDAAAGDRFGEAVAVFDDLVVVGASDKDDERGGAYIYRNTEGTTWVEERILSASDGMATTDDGTLNGRTPGDAFGDAVAVSGSLVIIGAWQVNGQLGAAYIYRNTEGTTWEETRISRENPPPPVGTAGAFGRSVAISGEVALVGAAAAQSNRGTGHLFRFNGSEWVETALVPLNRGDFGDPSSKFFFGQSVALSGDYAVLGAAFDSGFGNNGAAFFFNLAPAITWNTPAAITYGTALSSTQLNASAGSVPGTFSYSPASGTVLDAGTHTLTVNFTPTDTVRYTSTSKTVSITVNKATPTITWTDPAAIAYGTGLSGTQLNATSIAPGTITYLPVAGTVLGAGNGQSTAILPASTNFNGAQKTVSLNVTPAPLTITADDKQRSAGVANPALTASYSVFVNGDTSLTTSPTLSTTATPVSAPGTYPITVTGGSDSNYSITRVDGTLTVAGKELPTITWTDPAAITFGIALDGTQLNASASVVGSFSYSPASGAILDAGTHTLTANFTPTDTGRYGSASKTVSITVNKATPTITWSDPAIITYGTPLGGTQLNATSSAPGAITYTPAAGTVVSAGNGQSLTARLPASTNYDAATKAVTINVNPAPLTITADDKQRAAGLANPTLTASYSGFVDEDTALAPPPTLATTATTASAPGAYPITVSGGSDANYTITRVDGTLTVADKELPVLTWSNPAAIALGTALGGAQLNASASVEGTFSYDPPDGTVLASGTHTLAAVFTPADTATYAAASNTVSIIVTGKTVPVVTWNNPVAIVYGTLLGGDQLNATVAGVQGSFSYSPAPGSVLVADVHTLTATFTPVDDVVYATATATVELAVTKAPLIITADSLTRGHGLPNLKLTATYFGLVGGDAATSLDAPARFSTTATHLSNPGDYPVTVGGAADANYTISYQSSALTILEDPILAVDDCYDMWNRDSGDHTINLTANDQLSNVSSPFFLTYNDRIAGADGSDRVEPTDGYTLQLRSAATMGELASVGESLVIVALVGADLHIRIFDVNGAVAVNAAESELIQGVNVIDLKGLVTGNDVAQEERGGVMFTAFYVSGYIPGIFFGTPDAPVDFFTVGDGVPTKMTEYPKDDGSALLNKISIPVSDGLRVSLTIYEKGYQVLVPTEFSYFIRKGSDVASAKVLINPQTKPGDPFTKGVAVGPTKGWWELLLHLVFNAKGDFKNVPHQPLYDRWSEEYDQHHQELAEIGLNNPNLAAGSAVTACSTLLGREVRDDVLALEESGQMLKSFALFEEGLKALIAGKGETVLVTVEMVDSLLTAGEMFAHQGSPALKAAYARELTDVTLFMMSFVGLDFLSTAEKLGVDPVQPRLFPVSALNFDADAFSLLTVELDGIDYVLWKSTSLAADSWSKVDFTEETIDSSAQVILTDPNVVEPQAFYGIEAILEEQ